MSIRMKHILITSALLLALAHPLLAADSLDTIAQKGSGPALQAKRAYIDALYNESAGKGISKLKDAIKKSKDKAQFNQGVLELQWQAAVFAGDFEPAKYQSDSSLRNELEDLREDQLELFQELIEEDDYPLSLRLMLLEQISKIGSHEDRYKHDVADDTIEFLAELTQSKEPLIAETAMSALMGFVFQPNPKWDDQAQDAYVALKKALDKEETRLSVISLYFDAMETAKRNEDWIEKLGDKVVDALDDVESSFYQERFFSQATRLTKIHPKGDLGEIAEDLLKAAQKMDKIKPASAGSNLASQLKDFISEDDMPDLEALGMALEAKVTSGKAKGDEYHQGLYKALRDSDTTAAKAELIYHLMLRASVLTNDGELYQRTAQTLLEEQVVHPNSQRAYLASAYLHHLLSSTDRQTWLLPILAETERLAQSKLPLWQRQRLVVVLTAHAADAPNPSTGTFAAQALQRTLQNAPGPHTKLEAAQGIAEVRLKGQPWTKTLVANW